MSATIVAGIVALVVLLVGGGVGWSQIKKHGAERERRRMAEARGENATDKLKTVHMADLTDDQRPDFIDRL